MASTEAIAPGGDVRRRSQLAGLRRGLAMIGMTIGLLGTSLKPGFSAQQSDAKGKLSIETTDQSVETHIEMKGTIDKGLDATLSTTVKFDFCPDADGKVDVVFNSKTNLAKQGSKAGAKALMASAAGTKMALLINEPLATAQTTGISRLADTPVTCCALSARSSPNTPAVFWAETLVSTATSSAMAALLRAATLVITATSSSTVAMSSSRASRLDATVMDLVKVDVQGAGFYTVISASSARLACACSS